MGKKKKIYAIDLFCGAGGLTCGLEKAGVSVKLGIDIDPACEHPFSFNNKADFLLKSVSDVTAKELKAKYPQSGYRLLAGCAPCQTFSKYNQKADSKDKRWWLLEQFGRLVRQVKPDLVTMENVPGLVEQSVFVDFLATLEKLKYKVDYKIVNCAEYGLPQQRNRLVLVASRLGEIKLLSPNKNLEQSTVEKAIRHLPLIKAGEVYSEDPMHQSARLTDLNLKRIRTSIPGGTWRDWSKGLRADCHKKKTGKTYPSVYGRMEWDKPAPTITTQFFGFGNGRFGHPEQDRAISLREGAIFQGFPEAYSFTKPGDPIHRKTIGRLIGNAVPVTLGEVIGKSVRKHVESSNEC